jgi:hypothetical protein
MTGKIVDEEFFTFDRQGFMAKGYLGGGHAAIVAWNLRTQEQRFAPNLGESRCFLEGATVRGPFRPSDALPAQSVGVLVYE